MSFVLGITGWASETPPDEASALFGTTELSVHMESTGEMDGPAGLPSELYGDLHAGSAPGERTTHAAAGELEPSTPTDNPPRNPIGLPGDEPSSRAHLQHHEAAALHIDSAPAAADPDEHLELLIAESWSEEPPARSELDEARDAALPSKIEGRRAKPSDKAVPQVAVRVGNHGEYERVVFEWPEAIEHEVVQRAEQVTVAFSRAGRIDLSPLRDGFGQGRVKAREGGEVTDRVVLQVVPDASIRTFSPDGERVVVIDVYAEAIAQRAPTVAPEPERDSIEALRRSSSGMR